MTVPRFELATGYQISRVLKGGWQLAGGHGPVDRAAAIADMFAFAEAGITTFDCADIYTGVEELIGAFLREWRRVHPGRADEIHVHTKYVPDYARLGKLTTGEVTKTIERSLTRLGVDRVDLVQFHWWNYAAPGMLEAAGQLVELQRAGKIRLIGGTNFDTEHLGVLLRAGIPVRSLQVQLSALDRRPEGSMAKLCAEYGVRFLCYGSLAGGFLSSRWLGAPEPSDPLENRSLTKYKLIIDEFGGWPLFQELLKVLDSVGRKRGVSLGAAAVAFTLGRPLVAAAIVGARHARHLKDTLDAASVQLDDADRAAIESVISRAQGPHGEVYELERDKTGRHGRIMKYDLNDTPH